MAIYVWGNTAHGQLGLGGIEDEQILLPRQLKCDFSPNILKIACGLTHTLLLTKHGHVYSCGNNDYGQLGHMLPRKRPQRVALLDNIHITNICCGSSHSMALTENGEIYAWGSNAYGQLGVDTVESMNFTPSIIQLLEHKKIVQIACGSNHSLALSDDGYIYTWGSNLYGQLGTGDNILTKISKPTKLLSMIGIPIAFIVCGANHSFVLSKSGAVFGWGKNAFGQLGLNDEQSRSYPSQLKTMRSLNVRYIACGDDFSVFLTLDGGVFTCGSGTYGQLGHGGNNNELLPRMIMELMGTTCTQIACGRRHTLTFVPTRGRIYAFGLGGCGQLGTRTSKNSTTPQVVIGPWVSPDGKSLIANETTTTILNYNKNNNEKSDVMVMEIFAGGDQSLVITVVQDSLNVPKDFRFYEEKSQILYVTDVFLGSLPNYTEQSLTDKLERLFSSLACLNASFLKTNNEHLCCTSKNSGVDLIDAEHKFDYLKILKNEKIQIIIFQRIVGLITNLSASPPDVETLRIYIILSFYSGFTDDRNFTDFHVPFASAIIRLYKTPLKVLSLWWSTLPMQHFSNLLINFKTIIIGMFTLKKSRCVTDLETGLEYHENILIGLKILKILYNINKDLRLDKVPYDAFHIIDLIDLADLERDFVYWTLFDEKAKNKYICDFPFVFEARAKTLILQTDQKIQMKRAMDKSINDNIALILAGYSSPAELQLITLNVSRNNIVEDTLREIAQYGCYDCKKPLKVQFTGEEAIDAGGVRKEFFMLLLKDLLDTKYGMFREFEDSRALWFSEHSFEDERMYHLVGKLCGLAIYNFTIINVPFPLTLYKKLLKESVDLSDLRDLSPTLANSMQSILDYTEPDLEFIFCINFSITKEIFGETKTILLKPNGDNIPVTQENKTEFVDLYIDYVLNKSIENNFNAFYCGFMMVCGGKVLELFKSHELMALVIGNDDYDWKTLQAEADYKNGYTKDDQVIKWFWEVFHELSIEKKKNFLLFLTGSDRVPIRGMKDIKICFQPTNDEKCLPVAHTCFNLLDLPRYGTKERLKYKLLQAIEQTQGFSLV